MARRPPVSPPRSTTPPPTRPWGGCEVTGASAYDTSSVTGRSTTSPPPAPSPTPCSTRRLRRRRHLGGVRPGRSEPTRPPRDRWPPAPTASRPPTRATPTTPAPPSCLRTLHRGQGGGRHHHHRDDAATNSTWGGITKPPDTSAYDTSTVTREEGFIAPTGHLSYRYFADGSCTGGHRPAGTTSP